MFSKNRTPLNSQEYLHLIELIKEESKKRAISQIQSNNNKNIENVFCTKSFLTLLVFSLSLIFTQVDEALIDGKFSTNEIMGIAITLVGGISTTLARALEKDVSVYTPHGLPGLNKEDYLNLFIDNVSNIIDDEKDDTFIQS